MIRLLMVEMNESRFQRSAVGVLCLLLAVVLPVPGLLAQEAESGGEPDAPFFDVVDVEIVNIDVWVTGDDGRPMTGLTREDFIVERDGKPVEITNFYAVANGRAVGGTEMTVTPEVADPIELSDADGLPEEHQLWLIVYVDNYNIDALERMRVLPSVQHFLARTLQDGDRAMLVTFDRGLKVRQPFTDDLDPLMDILREISDDTGFASLRDNSRANALQYIDDARNTRDAIHHARRYADEQMDNVERSNDALVELIESLGGLPGRKAVLHVSSGMPMLAGEELFQLIGEKFNSSEAFAEIPRYDVSRSFERIARLANAHRVAVHTLDAGGLRPMRFGGADQQGFANPKVRTVLDSVVPENLQAPLRFVARETGGRAILNRNDTSRALGEVLDDFRSFYSLGVASSEAESGRYHDIEVKLRDKPRGARLRHRSGFRSKDLDTRTREQLRSALLYQNQRNPLGITVTWADPQPHDDKTFLLPLQLRVPLQDVVLLPVGEDTHEARLELYVAAASDDGAISEIDSSPFGLRLAEEHVDAARAEALLHRHQLVLTPGRRKIGVAVLDRFARQSSILTTYLQVGEVVEKLDTDKILGY